MRPLLSTPALPNNDSVTGASVGSVVQRQMRIEDGQKRDRLDRGREQADAAIEQTRARRVQQPQRSVPSTPRRSHARACTRPAGERRTCAAPPTRPRTRRRRGRCSTIGERRWVGEVVRVQIVSEHRDRASARNGLPRRRCTRRAVPARRPTVAARGRPRAPPPTPPTPSDGTAHARPLAVGRSLILSSWHTPRSSDSCRCA